MPDFPARLSRTDTDSMARNLFVVIHGALIGLMCLASPAGAGSQDACGLSGDVVSRVTGMLSSAETSAYRGTLLVEYAGNREFVAVEGTGSSGLITFRHLNRSADAAPETRAISGLPWVGLCELASYYGFASDPGQPVAGRQTYRLTIRPKDTLRLGYVMDVDQATHVPLRIVTLTSEGQLLERFEFAEFAALEQTLEPQEGIPVLKVTQGPHRLASLPPGFSVISSGHDPVEHWVLSDGLATLSIYVEPRPDKLSPGEGFVVTGATLAYTRGSFDRQLITVVGEVPLTTARLVAESVRPFGGQ